MPAISHRFHRLLGRFWSELWQLPVDGLAASVSFFPSKSNICVLFDCRYNISEAECVAGMFVLAPKAKFKIERDYDLRVSEPTLDLSQACVDS